jgi:hypothetical protein
LGGGLAILFLLYILEACSVELPQEVKHGVANLVLSETNNKTAKTTKQMSRLLFAIAIVSVYSKTKQNKKTKQMSEEAHGYSKDEPGAGPSAESKSVMFSSADRCQEGAKNPSVCV